MESRGTSLRGIAPMLLFIAVGLLFAAELNAQWNQCTGSNQNTCAGSNVGIGTTSPSQLLDVNGTSIFRNNTYYGAGTSGDYGISWASASPPRFIIYANAGKGLSLGTNGLTDKLYIDPSGNVGIGTTAPGGLFQVTANSLNALFTSNSSATSGYSRVFVNNDAGRGPTLVAYGSAFPGTSDYSNLPYADLDELIGYSMTGFVISTNSAVPLVFGTGPGPAERMRNTSDGKVGIGTPLPLKPLDVNGTAQFGTTFKVAIGYASGFLGEIPDGNIAYSNGSNLSLYSNPQGSGVGKVGLYYFNSSHWLSGAEVANTASGFSKLLLMKSGGSVGIGTSVPAYPLDVTRAVHVTGDLLVGGSITGARVLGTVFQDVAEWVPSEEELTPGTVVVLRSGHTNEVTASREPYDTKVAGVVSAQPGILLGQGGDHKAKIAATGRVRVRVSARQNAVAVVDLLVTSNVPGTAMYSEPIEIAGLKIHRPGTIIGKALEPLQSGGGEILVLLSLQ